MLNRLTQEAEAWAEAGTAKVNEVKVGRDPAWSKLHKEVLDEPAPEPPSLLRRAG